MVQLSHPYMPTAKPTALTIWTFVSKVIGAVLNHFEIRRPRTIL